MGHTGWAYQLDPVISVSLGLARLELVHQGHLFLLGSATSSKAHRPCKAKSELLGVWPTRYLTLPVYPHQVYLRPLWKMAYCEMGRRRGHKDGSACGRWTRMCGTANSTVHSIFVCVKLCGKCTQQPQHSWTWSPWDHPRFTQWSSWAILGFFIREAIWDLGL